MQDESTESQKETREDDTPRVVSSPQQSAHPETTDRGIGASTLQEILGPADTGNNAAKMGTEIMTGLLIGIENIPPGTVALFGESIKAANSHKNGETQVLLAKAEVLSSEAAEKQANSRLTHSKAKEQELINDEREHMQQTTKNSPIFIQNICRVGSVMSSLIGFIILIAQFFGRESPIVWWHPLIVSGVCLIGLIASNTLQARNWAIIVEALAKIKPLSIGKSDDKT